MKKLFFATIISISPAFTFVQTSECGDGKVYAMKSQTKNDDRFDQYPKIENDKDGPKYKGGDKALDKYVKKNIVLADKAKSGMWVLNYQFTVTCEGKITDVKQIGDSKADDWTNIVEVINGTSGWSPAMVNGKPVDCVYFRRLYFNRGEFMKIQN